MTPVFLDVQMYRLALEKVFSHLLSAPGSKPTDFWQDIVVREAATFFQRL